MSHRPQTASEERQSPRCLARLRFRATPRVEPGPPVTDLGAQGDLSLLIARLMWCFPAENHTLSLTPSHEDFDPAGLRRCFHGALQPGSVVSAAAAFGQKQRFGRRSYNVAPDRRDGRPWDPLPRRRASERQVLLLDEAPPKCAKRLGLRLRETDQRGHCFPSSQRRNAPGTP